MSEPTLAERSIRIKAAADKIVAELKPLSDAERLDAIATAQLTFCFDCGRMTPHYSCHCENDE